VCLPPGRFEDGAFYDARSVDKDHADLVLGAVPVGDKLELSARAATGMGKYSSFGMG